MLANCKTAAERDEILEIIRHGSIMCWGHINLQGEFDFTKKIKNYKFDIDKILALKIE